MFRQAGMVFALGSIFTLGSSMPAAWAHGTTERVSISSGGAQGGGYEPAISADGRFVAFNSSAFNLVPGDTNGWDDVFIHDRKPGTTERVSVSSGGAQGNNSTITSPAISADGRFVAFASLASNLVPGDTNGWYDVFVCERQTGTTRRESVSSGGTQGNGDSRYPSLSADGRFVAFASIASNLVQGDTNRLEDVLLRDRKMGTTRRVSVGTGGGQANGISFSPSLSANGRFVAFGSQARNLVPGDTNLREDVFVRTLAP